MRKIIFLYLICLYSISSLGQVSKLNIIQRNRIYGDSYKEKKNYDSAAIFYSKTINDEVYTLATDYLKLSYCNLLLKDTVDFKSNLDKGIMQGADSSLIRIYYRGIVGEDSVYVNNYLKSEYILVRNKFNLSIDTSIINYMDKIKELDQLFRKKVIKDTNSMYYNEMTSYIDSINYIRIKQLIEANKYPGFHSHGIQSANYTVILYHITDTDEDKFDYIFKFMKNQVLKGNMSIEEVRGFVTRHYGNKGGKFGAPCNYYGTKFAYQKTWSNLPYCDCIEIDNFRKEIGLETIRDYYQRENIELPSCYIESHGK